MLTAIWARAGDAELNNATVRAVSARTLPSDMISPLIPLEPQIGAAVVLSKTLVSTDCVRIYAFGVWKSGTGAVVKAYSTSNCLSGELRQRPGVRAARVKIKLQRRVRCLPLHIIFGWVQTFDWRR